MTQVPSASPENSASETPMPQNANEVFDPLGESGDMGRAEATAIIVGVISTGALLAIFYATHSPEKEPSGVDESTIMDKIRGRYSNLFSEKK